MLVNYYSKNLWLWTSPQESSRMNFITKSKIKKSPQNLWNVGNIRNPRNPRNPRKFLEYRKIFYPFNFFHELKKNWKNLKKCWATQKFRKKSRSQENVQNTLFFSFFTDYPKICSSIQKFVHPSKSIRFAENFQFYMLFRNFLLSIENNLNLAI